MATPGPHTQLPQIAAATGVGAVALTVRDLDRAASFYREAIGLEREDRADGTVRMHAAGVPLVELTGDRSAAALDRRASGLFHLAILLPDRRALAASLMRVIRAGGRLDGASDHLVSEALYLSDPEGNGIELYRDRPREEWPHEGGSLQMATLPLDLDDLLSELAGCAAVDPQVPAGTTMGHVHLQVTDVEAAEGFWHEIVGFEVMVRGYPGALFVAAGGYHHHLGLNTWNSAGRGPAPAGSVGLRWFEIVLPDATARDAVLERVRAAGLPVGEADGAPLIRDPAGNAAVLRLV